MQGDGSVLVCLRFLPANVCAFMPPPVGARFARSLWPACPFNCCELCGCALSQFLLLISVVSLAECLSFSSHSERRHPAARGLRFRPPEPGALPRGHGRVRTARSHRGLFLEPLN